MADAPAAQCPLCGDPLAAGATQCTNCGALIPAPPAAPKRAASSGPECPECGERVELGVAECPACGHAFASRAGAPRPAAVEEAHLLEELEWAIAGEVARPPPPLLPEIPQEALAEKRRLLIFVAGIPGVSREAAESVAEFFLNAEQIGMTDGDEVAALPHVTPEEARRIMDAVRRRLAERKAAAPVPTALTPSARRAPARPSVGRSGPPPWAVVRDFAAIGTIASLPVAALASNAGVPGHEWGLLFLFGVLLGLAGALAVPALRGSRSSDRRMEGFASAVWIAGLSALAVLSVPPLVDGTGGAPNLAVGATAGALAFGGALVLALRRLLHYVTESRLLRAEEASAKRAFDDAIRAYEGAISLSRWSGRDASAAWAGKGATLVAAGRFTAAVESLDRALAADPENEVAWINKGTALSRLGRMNEALRCFNAAIKANARYEVAWNNKGNALARLGKHDLALQCYDRALDLDPAFRTAWVNRGFILAKLGRFREAAECANAAIRLTTGAAAA